MLIEFTVTNYRSIKHQQTLSMVSANSRELQNTNTTAVLEGRLDLVRTAAIYGPNASGKSNLIKALQTMIAIVLWSAQSQRGDEVPVTPYLFDRETQDQPTEFEVHFVVDDVRYQYGFAASKQQILEEWLFAFPKGRSQNWIDRKFNPQTQKYEWGNTEKLAGPKYLWQEATRLNALFLSTAIQLNSTQLQPVFDWFQSTLQVYGNAPLTPDFTIKQVGNGEGKQQVLDFLQAADFAIADLEVERKYQYEIKYPMRRMEMAAKLLAERPIEPEGEQFDVKTVHLGSNGERFALDLQEESDGTRKFFALTGPWLAALERGAILIVDELNDNLHPKLVKFLVQMFHDNNLNRHNAQLIFTTHETSILNQEVFRRDQVWFTEKDEFNATTLYPLSDFSPRKGVENLEKHYLQGRYGALPYFRTANMVLEGVNGA
jgi:AAA15 family ATPase/GTPase